MEKRHFVTGDFTCHTEFLPPGPYATIRDNVVRGCADNLIMNKESGEILLGERNVHPWPSWFTFGGRIIPGESPSQAAARIVKADTGLEDVNPKFLDILSLSFSRRNEPPQHHGCHDINLFHLCLIGDDQAKSINIEKKEYDRVEWMNPNEVLNEAWRFHPALYRAVSLALAVPQEKWWMRRENHFEVGRFHSHREFLDDETFSMVRDNAVRGCADGVIVNHRGEILLGKRTIYPWPDWWVIGGGIIPGESPRKALARNIKRELNIDIVPERGMILNGFSFVWDKRQQKPEDHGCHDLSVIHVLPLEESEVESIVPNEEYDNVQWVKPRKVIRNDTFHPAIQRMAEDLIQIWE